jgi:hypothetical protein
MLIRVVEEDGAPSIYIVQSNVSVAHSTINDMYIDKRRGFAKPFYSKCRTKRHIRLAPKLPWGDLPLLGTQAVEIDDDDDQNAGDNSLPKRVYVEQIGAVVDRRQDEGAQKWTMHRADRAKEAGAADD